MSAGSRILLLGGHEFNRRSGNAAICDEIASLADTERPRICLLPTASGDPEDQIASFRRAFAERDCHPSAISLFRLGTEPIDVRAHLLAQDAIYVGGGSLVNLMAIWQAHGIDRLLRECAEEGILICGQSAGAMCWFEAGVTRSSGLAAAAPGMGVLPGSACVHYSAEPDRRRFFCDAIQAGELPPGLGLDDQAAVLYEGGRPVESISARPGALVWRVEPGPGGGPAVERPLDSRRISDPEPAIDALRPEIVELRETLAARAAGGRSRRRSVGRLD